MSIKLNFLHLFFTSIILGVFYIYTRYIYLISDFWKLRFLISLILFSPLISLFLYFFLLHKGKSGTLHDLLAWYAYLGLGFLSFLFFLIILYDGIYLLFKINPFKQLNFINSFLIQIKKDIPLILTFTALILSLISIYNANTTPAIKKQHIKIPELNHELEGFSIIQISDIHIGPCLKQNFLKRVVEKINLQKADIVVLTGDLIDGFTRDLKEEINPLKDIKANYGKFFITGNHEYYFNALDWIEAIEERDFKLLLNTHAVIRKGEALISLAGIPDLDGKRFIKEHRADPALAIDKSPTSSLKILLSHQASTDLAKEALKSAYDIVISGHTHGGQIFPWNFFVKLNQPFLAGLYNYEGLQLYISRGTGYWGPPMRLFAPSEITKIILSKK